MSADISLTGMANCHGDHSWQLTYNYHRMLGAAGFPSVWRVLNDTLAGSVSQMLREVAETLKADPDRFRQLEPENGWGNYEHCLEVIDQFATACAQHPEARITIS